MQLSLIKAGNFLKYYWFTYTVVLLFAIVAAVSVGGQDTTESPDPALLNEPGSTRALAVNAEGWRGGLPSASSRVFRPGSSIVVFVSGIGLLPGEGASAFRVFAEDREGKRYRFTVEGIQRVAKGSPTFGLSLRLIDETGYNRQPPAGELLVRVAWRGNASNRLQLILGKREATYNNAKGPFPSGDTAAPYSQARQFQSGGDRKRFMEQASFGPSDSLDFRLRQIGLRRWIEEQFVLPYPSIPYPNLPPRQYDAAVACGGQPGVSPQIDLCYRDFYWAYTNQNWFYKEALYGNDQLRRRISWALHQIWVISENTLYQQRWMQEYIEILDRHAFGNYRDLMMEMTLSPGMGEYLDMIRSTRMNPNENYPRELLQLFTIGLDLLNPDGTLILDGSGNRVPTYDQAKINELTKVFTGFSKCDNGLNPACSNAVVGAPNYIDPMHIADSDKIDLTAKTLLEYPGAPGVNIAACQSCVTHDVRSTYAYQSLNQAIDNIFYHPNVGPFVGKLLIQQLVTSDPTPAYVARVAAAFNNNGFGVRGDMKAVVRAILLDPEARGSRKSDPAYGKLREPIQHLTNILRMFNVRAARYSEDVPATPPASCQDKSDGTFAWMTIDTGQEVWYPPNVFSYYSPFAVVPGTTSPGPEFALAHTGSAVARNNLIFTFAFSDGVSFDRATPARPYPWIVCGTSIDRTQAISWAAADPTGNTLIEGLNSKMMHGTMSEAMKTKLRAAISLDVPAEYKARQAIFLVASSSQYQIQR